MSQRTPATPHGRTAVSTGHVGSSGSTIRRMSVPDHPPTKRPASLSQAARRMIASPGRGSHDLREFLDEFYLAHDQTRRQAMLDEPPPMTGTAQTDAYLAAAAEHLARQYGLKVPPWTEAPVRFLTKPCFPAGTDAMRAHCLVHSPTAFRRRMIFVDESVLARASQHATTDAQDSDGSRQLQALTPRHR